MLTHAHRLRRLVGLTATAALLTPALAHAAPNAPAKAGPLRPEALRRADVRLTRATPATDCFESPAAFANTDSWFFACDGNYRIAILGRPQHGHLDTYVDEGYTSYVPVAGYVGPDAVTFTATAPDGTVLGPRTVTFDVKAPAPPTSTPTPDTSFSCSFFGSPSYVRAGRSVSYPYSCFGGVPSAVTASNLSGEDADGTAVPDAEVGSVSASAPIPDDGGAHGTITYVGTRTDGGDVAAGLDLRYDVAFAGAADSSGSDSFTTEDRDANQPYDQEACGTPGPATVEATFESAVAYLGETCGSDPEGDPQGYALGTVTNGSARLTDGDTVQFTGAAAGPATIGFTLTDQPPAGVTTPASSSRTFSVNVDAIQPNAVCARAGATTGVNTPVDLALACANAASTYLTSASTDDTFSRSIATHGSLDIAKLDPATGRRNVRYYPDAGFVGTDGWKLVGSGKYRDGDPADVTVTVAAPVPVQGGAPAAPSAKALALAYLKRVAPKTLKALAKALGKNRLSPKVGPFQVATKVTFVGVGKVPSAKQAGAHKKRKKAKAVKLVSGSVALAANKTGTLRLKLTKAGKRALKRTGRLKVTGSLTLTATGTGATTSTKRSVTIKAKKAKRGRGKTKK